MQSDIQNDIKLGDVVFLRTYEDIAANYPPESFDTVIYYGPFAYYGPYAEKGTKTHISDYVIPYMGKFYTVQGILRNLPSPCYDLKGAPYYYRREALIPLYEMEETVPWADVIGKVIS